MDRLTEMEVFMAVVDNSGFTGAAKKLGLSKSAVSKHITALEGRLGVSLLNRTTRRVSATETGLAYYHKVNGVLENARDADQMVKSMQAAPQGTLRVSAANDFGSIHLVHAVSGFLRAYEEISVKMFLDNRFVDIMAEGFDVAIRIGKLADSSLKAKKLAETSSAIIAAPEYLEKYGTPKKIDDLVDHRLLNYSNDYSDQGWRIMAKGGDIRSFRNHGGLTVNNGRSLLAAAELGVGLATLPSFIHAESLRAGKTVKILTDLPPQTMSIYAVYPPAAYTQPKLRAFIDYLAEHFKQNSNENW